MTVKRILALVLLSLILPAVARADNIRLKSGSTIKGKVLKFDGKEFTVVLDGTQSRALILLSDVAGIDFGDESAPSGETKIITPEEITVPEPAAPTVPKPEPGTPTAPSSQSEAPPDETKTKEFSFDVSAREVWVDTGVDLKRGQRVKITASGRVTLAGGRTTGPEGTDLKDPDKLIENEATGGLIGVIGDDNDEFFFVGTGKEFVSQRNGRLFLMLNEGSLENNNGAFKVRLQVERMGESGG
ncbi:MAG: hypothetical protein HY650_16315 [Acidobacteria bacterium]|nr:hypothetical protein [Acidobacteriota bacterium]